MTSSPVTMPLGQQLSALQALRATIALPPAPSHIEALGAACHNACTMILAPHGGVPHARPLPDIPRPAWRMANKIFAQTQSLVQAQLYRDARGIIDRALLKREELTFENLEGYARMGVVAEKAVRAFNTSAAHCLGHQLAEAGLTMGAVWRAAIEYGVSTGPSSDSWCKLQHFFEMSPLPSPKLPGPNDVTPPFINMSVVRTALGAALVQNTVLLARYGTPYASLWCEQQGIDDDLIARAAAQNIVSDAGVQQLFSLRAAAEKTERRHRLFIRVIGGAVLTGTLAVWAYVFNYAYMNMNEELKEAPYIALPIIVAFFTSLLVLTNPTTIMKWRASDS